MGMKGLQACP